MKIFLDFDDVIFHTSHFLSDLKKMFVSYGIDDGQFDDVYKNFLSPTGVNMITFDPWKQLDIIEKQNGIKYQDLRWNLNDYLSDTQKYVFDDVVPFLNKVGRDNSFVASHGSNDFQMNKIRSSKIAEYVTDIKVSEKPKWQSIFEVASGGKISLDDDIYFIDDKAHHVDEVKKKYSHINVILMKRPQRRYKDQVSQLADDEVASLDDLMCNLALS